MGGGGGGGRGLTPDELKNLEQRAKKSLKDGGGKCNVFISFSSRDLNDVNLLRGQVKNRNSDIEFSDWSLKVPFDSKKAEYIKRGIRERIRQCSVTVVYVSANTAGSAWVNWEIEESVAMGKRVVAIHKGNKAPFPLPKAVTDNKVPVVSWNQEELTNAIKGQSGK